MQYVYFVIDLERHECYQFANIVCFIIVLAKIRLEICKSFTINAFQLIEKLVAHFLFDSIIDYVLIVTYTVALAQNI